MNYRRKDSSKVKTSGSTSRLRSRSKSPLFQVPWRRRRRPLPWRLEKEIRRVDGVGCNSRPHAQGTNLPFLSSLSKSKERRVRRPSVLVPGRQEKSLSRVGTRKKKKIWSVKGLPVLIIVHEEESIVEESDRLYEGGSCNVCQRFSCSGVPNRCFSD